MPQNISRQTSKSLTGTRKGTHLVFFQGRLAPSSWVSPKHYDGSHLLSFCPIAKWPSSHGSQAWILFVVATLPPFEPKNKLQFWVAFLMFPLIRSTSRHIHLPFYSASQDSKYTTSHQTHYGLGRFPLNLWCYGLLVTFGKALVFFQIWPQHPALYGRGKKSGSSYLAGLSCHQDLLNDFIHMTFPKANWALNHSLLAKSGAIWPVRYKMQGYILDLDTTSAFKKVNFLTELSVFSFNRLLLSTFETTRK